MSRMNIFYFLFLV